MPEEKKTYGITKEQQLHGWKPKNKGGTGKRKNHTSKKWTEEKLIAIGAPLIRKKFQCSGPIKNIYLFNREEVDALFVWFRKDDLDILDVECKSGNADLKGEENKSEKHDRLSKRIQPIPKYRTILAHYDECKNWVEEGRIKEYEGLWAIKQNGMKYELVVLKKAPSLHNEKRSQGDIIKMLKRTVLMLSS